MVFRTLEHQAADWVARMNGPDAEQDRAAFERWYAASGENQAAYAKAQRLWAIVPETSAAATGEKRLPHAPQPFFWTRPAVRPAFALAVLLIVVLAGFAFFAAPGSTPGPQVAARSEASRVGEIRVVKLEDGSVVTLDTDSAIEVSLAQDLRRVRLVRGRARFDVTADATRPFVVEAVGRSVTALGTVFDVGVEPEGVRVTLLRGLVDVRGVTPAGGAAPVTRLSPGDCFSDIARKQFVAKAPKGVDRWASGMLDFDGVPLAAVIEETNRYSTTKVRLADASLGTLRVTGTFRPVPVDQLAASLAAAFSLRVERNPTGDLVLTR